MSLNSCLIIIAIISEDGVGFPRLEINELIKKSSNNDPKINFTIVHLPD